MNPLKSYILFIAAMSLYFTVNAQIDQEFLHLIERGEMQYTMPENFESIDVPKGKDMGYEFDIKHKSEDFEVRYAIRPLDEDVKTYNSLDESKRNSGNYSDPNTWYKSSFSNIIEITSGDRQQITMMDAESVKEEFNADWGASSFYVPSLSFAGNYKFCMAIAIHKDNKADAYVFFLSNDEEKLNEQMDAVFTSLTFKP